MSTQREVGLFEAKTRLSELVNAVEAGDTWTITRRGKVVARLVPVSHRTGRAAALRRLARLRREIVGSGITAEDVQQWRDEGRR